MYNNTSKKDDFRDALVSCMHTKRFQDVTISDLSRNSGVSRVTFYRYFNTTTDVLEYLCDSIFEQAHEQFGDRTAMDNDTYFTELLKYLMERSEMLDSIYRSRRIDLFQKSFMRHLGEIRKRENNGAESGDADYIRNAHAASFAAAFASIIAVWAEHGKRESAEDILRIFKAAAK